MLRGVAALLVVLFHTQGIFGARAGTTAFTGMFGSGFRGVDMFFVISGFIIAHVHRSDIGHPWRLGNYLFNRAARIYPAVWITTLLAGSLYALGFGGPEKIGKLAAWSVTASLLLLPQTGDALVGVTWTLKYELFFYLIFALLILDLRVGLVLLGAWQLNVLIATAWFPPDAPGLSSLPPKALGVGGFYLRPVCLEFSLGLGSAWVIGRRHFVITMDTALLQWSLLAAGIAAFAGGMIMESHTNAAGVFCALGAAGIIVALILMEQSGRIRIPDALVLVGGASYAIYLVHFSAITLLVAVLVHFNANLANAAIFLVAAAFGVAGGLAFDQLVDQPVQRLLRRRLKPAMFGVKGRS
jgi:peptidoglycan/LPS O-acetylase OafA/YrhL